MNADWQAKESNTDIQEELNIPAASAGARTTMAVILWVLALAILALTGFAGWRLWLAWQTGYELYWQQLTLVVPIVFFLAIAYTAVCLFGTVFIRFRPFIRQLVAGTDRARQAAIAGDDALAPLAAQQPEPLASSEMPIGPSQFGPFTRPKRRRTSLIAGQIFVVLFSCAFVTMFVAIAQFLPDLPGPPTFLFGGPTFVIMIGMFALVGLSSLAGLIVEMWRRVRRGGHKAVSQFVADDWGLRQAPSTRGGVDAQPIAWHEIRAFYKAEDRLQLNGRLITEGAVQSTTYTVDAGERHFSWAIWKDSTAMQRADSERLCRLIVTRSRQPLRDVSNVTTKQGLLLMHIILPLLTASTGQRFAYQIDQQRGVDGARSIGLRRPRSIVISCITMIALAFLLFAAVPICQEIRSSQYVALRQQIDTEQPYYSIDFRNFDALWPSHPATDTSGSYTFATDGYHMTGAPDGGSMEAVLPETYGDVTVELTAGLAGPTLVGDIGLVLRESGDGKDKVVFSTSATGGWSLARYQEATSGASQRMLLLGNEHSDAVRAGLGAYNAMAVIMRGGDYYLFVHETLVGIYHDDGGHSPRAGHMGLWLGNSHADGWFYYFGIYPAS